MQVLQNHERTEMTGTVIYVWLTLTFFGYNFRHIMLYSLWWPRVGCVRLVRWPWGGVCAVGRERWHPYLAGRRLVNAVAAREDRALCGRFCR